MAGGLRCAVAMCNNTSQVNANNPPEKHVSFHRFPTDKKISEIWFQRCKRSDQLKVKAARICSEHFTPEDFERDFRNELLGLPTRKKLKRKAIPTCKLNTAELAPQANCERKRRAVKRHQRSSLKEILSEPQKVKEEREEEIAIEEVLLPAYTSTSPSSNGDSGCCNITSEYFTLLRKYEEVIDENENLKSDLQRTTEGMENLKEQVKQLEKNCAAASKIADAGPSTPSTSTTPSNRGEVMPSQAREIVASVIHFMKKEAENVRLHNQPTIPLTQFRERILAATGISIKMYRTIRKESEAIAAGEATSFSTPRKKKQRMGPRAQIHRDQIKKNIKK